MPLNVLSFSHDFSMDQVLDKYYHKQNAFDILIQNGADPYLEDNDGSSLIHSAAEGGNTSIIIKLLSLGLDVDSRNDGGLTPLVSAALKDKQNAFDILIQNGAYPSFQDNKGFSMLYCAAQGRSTSIINKLLSLGLDIKLKDVYGVTSLTRAIEKNNFDAVKFLISKGAL